jgi:hypothetical protein
MAARPRSSARLLIHSLQPVVINRVASKIIPAHCVRFIFRFSRVADFPAKAIHITPRPGGSHMKKQAAQNQIGQKAARPGFDARCARAVRRKLLIF